MIQIVDIIGVDRESIIEALQSDLKDFEDVVQTIASEHNDIEAIITIYN